MRSTLLIVVATFALPRVATAQDTPRFGITMGYPAAVGVVWNIVDRVAVRPELNWTHSTTESVGTSTVFNLNGTFTTTTVTTTTTTTAAGYGVSALIFVATHDTLRTYVVPRLAYTRSSSSTDRSIQLPVTIPPPLDTTTSTYTASGSLGAQYALARRFGIFGELGVAFTRSTLSPPSSVLTNESKNRTVGIRSGAGVILFLGS